MRHLTGVLFTVIGPLLAPTYGQNSATNPPIPQIVVNGRGEVKVAPDRATIQISVQSRATTAAAAAADNAKKQSAVISAIKAIGLKDEQISTSNYSVVPEQKYSPNESPIVTGYTVTNTIVADVRTVATVGAIIDAALAHGANLISGLSFYSSNTDAARRVAIASAVEAARADADAAAKAAHGSLGELIEIVIGAFSPPSPRPMIMRAALATGQDETPISPGQESVTAEVTVRWRFISAP
jgi:uncharacterized protein YggE